MFKSFANLSSLLKQAQEVGAKMQSLNDALRGQRATGSAGGDMVVVEVNGLSEVVRVKIDPVLVSRGETEMIEDLTAAAVNQALSKAKDLHVEAIKSLAGGVDMAGFQEALAQFTGQGR